MFVTCSRLFAMLKSSCLRRPFYWGFVSAIGNLRAANGFRHANNDIIIRLFCLFLTIFALDRNFENVTVVFVCCRIFLSPIKRSLLGLRVAVVGRFKLRKSFITFFYRSLPVNLAPFAIYPKLALLNGSFHTYMDIDIGGLLWRLYSVISSLLLSSFSSHKVSVSKRAISSSTNVIFFFFTSGGV